MSGIQIPGANNYVAPVLANDDDAQANTDGTTGKFLEKYYHDKPDKINANTPRANVLASPASATADQLQDAMNANAIDPHYLEQLKAASKELGSARLRRSHRVSTLQTCTRHSPRWSRKTSARHLLALQPKTTVCPR